jgi:DNA-directed RNA polymerase beta' subunit
MDSGSAVGTIAAQSIGEPVTQAVLNSKHRAGTVGSSLNGLVRIKEIFGARPTEKMKSPTMRLYVRENATDKPHVQRIANHIEMMPLKRFVITVKIFFENYGEIKHPDFIHEIAMIKEFEKYTNKKPPGDIIKFVIRFELNKEELITKNMDLETIIQSLNKHFPHFYIINNAENSDTIVLRIYIRNIFKKTIELNDIIELSNNVLNHNVRGIDKITYTHVGEETRSYIDEHGNIKTKKEFMINTAGTNLSAVLMHPELDTFRCDTDSIIEISEVYGIHAARQKIISELKANVGGLNSRHYGIFADEATFSGHVTSISRQGLIKREADNVLLHVSDRFALINLMNAAVESTTDHIKGLSAKLMIGSVPEIGTLYNKAILNEKFIESNLKDNTALIDAL